MDPRKRWGSRENLRRSSASGDANSKNGSLLSWTERKLAIFYAEMGIWVTHTHKFRFCSKHGGCSKIPLVDGCGYDPTIHADTQRWPVLTAYGTTQILVEICLRSDDSPFSWLHSPLTHQFIQIFHAFRISIPRFLNLEPHFFSMIWWTYGGWKKSTFVPLGSGRANLYQPPWLLALCDFFQDGDVAGE